MEEYDLQWKRSHIQVGLQLDVEPNDSHAIRMSVLVMQETDIFIPDVLVLNVSRFLLHLSTQH